MMTTTSSEALLWEFVAERQRIYLNRLQGLPYETPDPILRKNRFTNVYRAADRVSQAVIRMQYPEAFVGGEPLSREDLFLRTMVFKIFNRIDTWQFLEEWSAGGVGARTWDPDWYAAGLGARKAEHSLFSGAYMLANTGLKGMAKEVFYLQLIDRMREDRVPQKLTRSGSLQEVYQLLTSYPGIGPFLGFQFTIDLNYSALTHFDEDDFVVPGPGAVRGAARIDPDVPAETVIRRLHEEQEAHGFDRLGGSRPLKLIDVQNVLCEFDKYAREALPLEEGMKARRIKQRYRPDPEPLPAPFFPPKWGLG